MCGSRRGYKALEAGLACSHCAARFRFREHKGTDSEEWHRASPAAGAHGREATRQ
jgi:hypothetical protein